VANALASLEGLDQRWQVSMGQTAEVGPDLRHFSTSMTAEGYSRTSAPRSESAAATTDGMDHRMAENAVIGAAVHDWPPGARAQVLGTVRDCDFTDTRAAATWRAVGHLADHDAPIDEITVAWQAMRARSRFGHGLTTPELRQTREAALFHEAGATKLANSTIARVPKQARHATARYAENPGVQNSRHGEVFQLVPGWPLML
jgi:DnaB-like helicase N terminal domain